MCTAKFFKIYSGFTKKNYINWFLEACKKLEFLHFPECLVIDEK